jgi:hypothetical protein
MERSRSNLGAIALLRQTIVSFATARRAVWRYLDILAIQIQKEIDIENAMGPNS